MNNITTICCVAGKSGGHLIPCLTFAQQQYKPHNLIFISTSEKLDTKILKQFPEITAHLALSLQDIPYKKWWRFPLFFFSCTTSFFSSFLYLKKHKPSRIISTGGFIAIPVICAARLLSIPVDLFELNVIPGKATSLISRFAENLFVCFPQAAPFFKKKAILKNYPVRFTNHDLKEYETTKTKKTIFILGGSQGSSFLNNLIQTVNFAVLQQFFIIHQTGTDAVAACTTFYKQHQIDHDVFDYRHDLAACYRRADMIICRAGAGTLFEILFFKKPALIIPLETAQTDHQVANAQAFVKQYPELFVFYKQDEFCKDPFFLVREIEKLLNVNSL